MNSRLMAILLLLLLCASSTIAQLVPLELDQMISLPAAGAIWDVMPHPDGYYLWVQAVRPNTAATTRIYWGRTESAGVDSFDLVVGAPQSLSCFWRDPNFAPCVVLGSKLVSPDSLSVRIYDLITGAPDSAHWGWIASSYRHPGNYYNWDQYSYAADLIAPCPAAPSVSHRVMLGVTSYRHDWGQEHGYGTDEFSCPTVLVLNLLDGTGTAVVSGPGSGYYSSWTQTSSEVIVGYSGNTGGSYSNPSNPGYERSSSSVQVGQTHRDSISFFAGFTSCSSSQIGCTIAPVAVTHDSVGATTYCFTYVAGQCDGALAVSPSRTSLAWTVSMSYGSWLAAECVSGNSAEEFLCYDGPRRVFDVLGAADGHNYGVTDTITLGSEPRIVGRYDSTSRRLVFREGNQLKLYRIREIAGPPEPPFSITDFTGSWEATGVRLRFTARLEHHIRAYEVWRKRSGYYDAFSQILAVPAALGSDSVKCYSCIDSTALDSAILADGADYFLAVLDSSGVREVHPEEALSVPPRPSSVLSYFAAIWEPAGVRLTFTTRWEYRVRWYEVWRSFETTTPFVQGPLILAAPGADSLKSYSLLDSAAIDSICRVRGLYYFLAVRDSVGHRVEHREIMVHVPPDPPAPPPPVVYSYGLSSYPNPFNSSATIVVSLAKAQHARLEIYDLAGRQVRTLADELLDAGNHPLSLDASSLPSGLYFARLTAGEFTKTQKLLLLK